MNVFDEMGVDESNQLELDVKHVCVELGNMRENSVKTG